MGEYVSPGIGAAGIYGLWTSWGLLRSVWQKVMVVKENEKKNKKVGFSVSARLLGSSLTLSCPGGSEFGGVICSRREMLCEPEGSKPA